MKQALPLAVLIFQLPVAFGDAVTAFEVASIKPSKSVNGNSSGITTKTGFLRAENVTLKRCIRGAWNIPDQQVLGGPKWIDDNRYDIDAKAAGRAGDGELNLMLQALLSERFKLVVHRETRQLSGYALVLGKGGLKAKPSAPEAESVTNSSRGVLEATACTMAQLALKISLELRQPVIDMTDAKGSYDFKLQWTPENMRDKPASDAAPWPSIFSAVQEQLGLRLESRKVPAEVLIVDHAEEPSAN